MYVKTTRMFVKTNRPKKVYVFEHVSGEIFRVRDESGALARRQAKGQAERKGLRALDEDFLIK